MKAFPASRAQLRLVIMNVEHRAVLSVGQEQRPQPGRWIKGWEMAGQAQWKPREFGAKARGIEVKDCEI